MRLVKGGCHQKVEPTRKSYWYAVSRITNENRIFLFILLLGIFVWQTCPIFATQLNSIHVSRDVAEPGMVACACLMLMVTGYFDLSVGANVALAGAVAAKLSVSGFPMLTVFFIVLLLGAAVGVANAIIVLCFKINSIVATLSMMSILRGIILLYTNKRIIVGMPKSFLWLGQGSVGPLEFLFLSLLLVAVLSYVILQKSVFGRHLYIIGAKRQSAFLSGIRTNFSVALVYIYVGLICAFVGIIYAARHGAAMPTALVGMELTVIAAIIVGGARLLGGQGTVVKTLAGVVLMELIFNAINLNNIQPGYSQVIQGLIIVFAVTYTVIAKKSPNQ